MEWLAWAGIATAVIGAVALAPRIHRSTVAHRRAHGGLGGGLGVIDEVFRPTQHEARLVQEQQQEAGDEAPAPGEPRFRLPGD